MNKILSYLLLTFFVSLGLYTFGAIANFFGIGFQYYGVYSIFGIAILFLYLILPKKTETIFNI